VSVRSLLREPLLHFLLIGLALFFLYGRASPGDSDSRRIVVSQSQVDDMVGQYRAAFNRSPTPTELKGLIDTYVHDEIIYREGLSLGLDKDDAVIKRRVRQKYDLIAEEGKQAEPTDADLAAYLKAHPAEFLRPALVSFEQIFFDPSATSPKAVESIQAALIKGADPAKFGQPSMLPRKVTDSSIDLVARDFGDDFAKRVGAAPVGQWVGPIASGIGVHLVRVSARAAPAVPPLSQIRAAVAREWESDQRARSSETDYRKARANYDVIIKAKLP
jgi:parvulin-like peptidyl-prolyl isomerase